MKHLFKNILVLLFLVIFMLPAYTQAQTLGRLFSTPNERRQLDANRSGKPFRQSVITTLPTLKQNTVVATQLKPVAAPTPHRPNVINGFVRRSDGPNTVWLNEKPLSGNAARAEWLQPSAVNSPVRVQTSPH
jgi:hypothetical protein